MIGAAVLAVALTLGGCAGDPRAAATVDGRTVTTQTLHQTVEDLSPFVSADQRNVLVALVVAPHFIDAAAEHGVGVSEADARELIDQNLEAAGVAPETEIGDGAVEVVRFTIAANNLSALPDAQEVLSGLDREIQALDIDVNPRFGSFDAGTGSIVAGDVPWIISPQ